MPQASSRETVVFASMVGGSLFKKLLWRAGTCGFVSCFPSSVMSCPFVSRDLPGGGSYCLIITNAISVYPAFVL